MDVEEIKDGEIDSSELQINAIIKYKCSIITKYKVNIRM